MTSKEFEGRVALVTGGSRGIGRAVAIDLARAGAKVAVNYIDNAQAAEDTLAAVRAEGGDGAVFQGDISDPKAVSEMVAGVEATLGPVDLLVTSAGIVRSEAHTEMDFERWRRMMAVNVDGTYLPVMAVKDGMIARGYGRIVCLASVAGLRARGQLIAYSATKAAVIAFARSCAEAFGPHVRVNSVAPGFIETDMTAGSSQAVKQRLAEEAFLKRVGQPEEIARTVLFLLSDRSSFTTGQTYVADGGRVTLP